MLTWSLKPGIRKIGMQRDKEITREDKGMLGLLLVRQAYLNKKIKCGQTEKLIELETVHGLIQKWYENKCNKIKSQSRATEFLESEKVNIYHHEILIFLVYSYRYPGLLKYQAHACNLGKCAIS